MAGEKAGAARRCSGSVTGSATGIRRRGLLCPVSTPAALQPGPWGGGRLGSNPAVGRKGGGNCAGSRVEKTAAGHCLSLPGPTSCIQEAAEN